jgi:hypothetical protein
MLSFRAECRTFAVVALIVAGLAAACAQTYPTRTSL